MPKRVPHNPSQRGVEFEDAFAVNAIVMTIDLALVDKGMGPIYGKALGGVLASGFPGTIKLRFTDSRLPKDDK